MSMVMAQAAPEPRLLGAAKVKKLTASIGEPIPTELLLGKKRVSIAGLVGRVIDNFRHQREMLESNGRSWPCVRVTPYASDSKPAYYLVPLDLGTDAKPKGDRAEISSGRAGNRAAKAAHAAGFKVQEISPSEADKAFAERLGELLEKHAVGGIGNSEPPHSPFEVTTDSAGVEIVYSIGYFVSTKQGFGFSSPAKRELEWGSYLFGTNIGGVINFGDTLWPVPDVDLIHISV
ncbi:hypothetical protein [Rugamonas rivuli]|uniref:Uncharacterized protein n=1 Tax=Rugamonas rivuli TaxID=2743358 RepID=A0A843S4G4_9BURK|nr:hypothetical protein [Rugamonas rivuli]MQA19185.1 hypothetical protein [Rugamonas rivuli]